MRHLSYLQQRSNTSRHQNHLLEGLEKPDVSDEAPRRGAHDTGREEGLAQRNLLHRRLRASVVGHCGTVVPGSRFAIRGGFSSAWSRPSELMQLLGSLPAAALMHAASMQLQRQHPSSHLGVASGPSGSPRGLAFVIPDVPWWDSTAVGACLSCNKRVCLCVCGRAGVLQTCIHASMSTDSCQRIFRARY